MHAPRTSNVSLAGVIDVKRAIIVILYIITERYVECNLLHSRKHSSALDIVQGASGSSQSFKMAVENIATYSKRKEKRENTSDNI